MSKQIRLVLLILVLAAAGILLWMMVQRQNTDSDPTAGVSQTSVTVFTAEEQFFGKYASQKVCGENAESLLEKGDRYLRELEQTWSGERTDSILAQINSDAGLRATQLDEETYAFLQSALELSAQSDGLFALSAAPLAALWEGNDAPEANQISSALSALDDSQIVLDSEAQTIFLPRPGISLCVDGVVRGYAAGKLMEQYQQTDYAEADLGGVQMMMGQNPDGTPLTVTLRDADGIEFGTLTGFEGIAAVSGGKVLDNRTGMPAESDLKIVCVLSQNGMQADYLADVLYVGGREKVVSLLENAEEYSIIALDENGEWLISQDLQEKFSLSAVFSDEE